MADYTLRLTAAQETKAQEIADYLAALDPPQGDGTIAGALPLVLKQGVRRMNDQAIATKADLLREQWPRLSAAKRAAIEQALS